MTDYYGLSPSQTCLPLRLADYADTLGINNLLFWGVKRGGYVPEDTMFYDTNDRALIRSGLYSACRQIAQYLHVNLCPQWTPEDGEEHLIELDQYSEVGGYPSYTRQAATLRVKLPLSLSKKHLIEAGKRAFSVYDDSATIVYAGDYGTVTVAHGNVGLSSEVRVYYPDGLYRYGPDPSSIQRTSTHFVIRFPRERLIDPILNVRGEDTFPADWTNDAHFLSSMTVAREYNDPSTHAILYVIQNCLSGCSEQTETACIKPRHKRLGKVTLTPAGYQNGKWCLKRCWGGIPYRAMLHYRSGLQTLPDGYLDAIIRLSHTLIPEAPCPTGHQPQDRFWARDRAESNIQTRERINCPWGRMDGAWYAWNFFSSADENYNKGGGLLA